MKQPTLHFFVSSAVLAFIASICLSGLSAAKDTNVTSSIAGGLRAFWAAEELELQSSKATNGWFSILKISNLADRTSLQPAPICYVSVPNITTNRIMLWDGVRGEAYSTIELINSNGELVPKTGRGKMIGTCFTDQQIKEMVKVRYQQWVAGKTRTPGFVSILPEESFKFAFSLPQMFEIKEAGEYTLKFQTCIIQKSGGEGFNPDLKITWLPESAVRISIKTR